MHNNDTEAIIFDNVSLTIGSAQILTDISLNIKSRTITGLLGPNGAGKTSFLSLVIGLTQQTSGEITVLGEKLPAKGESLRKKIGVVFQETTLYEELTIAENLLFFASLYDVMKPKQRIKEVLELLGLTDRINDQVNTLSGGLKRRTAIARALLHNPQLLIVDEPTLGVDVETRHTIWEHLKSLRSQGHTILVASNYLDEAQAICDTVSILNQGQLITSDTPFALIARTGHNLDIECASESAEKISHALANNKSVVRSEKTTSGISVFLKGDTIPDTIINGVLKDTSVNAFRFRPADLSEVFKALQLTSTSKKETKVQPKSIFKRNQVLMIVWIIIIVGVFVFLEVWFSQPK
ncbi:MAG TPA: ABC transporter ATP-binding protein [Candidatus Saccharimonadales bacterium]|nr:ABC transporter ATP-binding protein [Candidatus Saccharimonadales bacterium]